MTILIASSSCNLATDHNPGGMGWANRIWLTPSKWDSRKPWFWDVGNGLEDQQSVKDAEIKMMHQCGIDAIQCMFFPESIPRPTEFAAFPRSQGDLYDGANQDFMLHITSPYRDLVKITIGLGGSGGSWAPQVAYLVNLFQQSYYLKVGANRPVVCLLFPDGLFIGFSGRNVSQAQADIAALTSAVLAAGMGTPFYIGQGGEMNGAIAMPNFSALGLNSASIYPYMSGPQGESFASFAARLEASWDSYHTTFGYVVPGCSTGMDFRPLSDVNGLAGSYMPPDPSWPAPNVSTESVPGPWQVAPTPAELGTHLKHAFAWNPTYNFYDLAMVYSWSEPTECGRSLRPLRGDGGRFLQEGVALPLQRQWESPRALRAAGIPINSPAIVR